MFIQDYLDEVQSKWQTDIAREHAYRPVLESLIKKILPDLTALNDPARIHVGTLDFIIRRGEIDVGYIEAKDLNTNLDKVEKSEQLKRYLDLDNLILTDYLEFRFYREGKKIDSVRIGDALMGRIQPRPENFDKLKILLEEFGVFKGQTIRSSQKLAEMMARKARLMREVFHEALSRDEPSSLKDQCKAFKEILMHDLNEKEFSDIYAQTITYGLFTARLHDPSLDDFSRAEAQGLIPKSNPFLRQLFHYVTGPDLDSRVVWIVNDLCNLFQAVNVRKLFEDYGKDTRQTDPVLHFYETFLGAYDKSIRDMRGVWFTPEPVVQYIVKAIDEVLVNHFGLKDGISDNSKIQIELDTQTRDDRSPTGYRRIKKDVHKVQLLDVATGTGTFLAEVVKQIYPRFEGVRGIWNSYIENDLLPRMHGFELLMASYAMCHMKLDLLLSEMGYKPSNPDEPPRVSVYLTNSLEEHHPDTDMLWASFISKEANAASRIKRDMPIMVAFGNPPYNNSSTNKGAWISGLMKDYKKGLEERKSNTEDDYIKFIRLSEHYIEKNGSGLVAMITNSSYVDGITQRIMRHHLLKTFDEIYILDLGGDVKKAEVAKGHDQNVFDIQQGVAICILIKSKRNKKSLGKLFYKKLNGKRKEKYDFLSNNTLQSSGFGEIVVQEPNYYFYPRDYSLSAEYEEGFSVNKLFPTYSSGIQTKRDNICISFSKKKLEDTLEDFRNLKADELRIKYELPEDGRDWKIDLAKKDIIYSKGDIETILYRPFDERYIYYSGKTKGFVAYPRRDLMQHVVGHKNLSLIMNRQCVGDTFSFILATTKMNCHGTFYLGNRGQDYLFPLYRYEEIIGNAEQKVPNLDPSIYAKIKNTVSDVTPEMLFDYIYAVLHSPSYRRHYAEFLKSDFPRIPYPDHLENFYALVKKGAEIRELHLLEGPLLDNIYVTYPISGDNIVGKPEFERGKIFINKEQYFDGVSEVAWNLYIGGYQPAQKWLKDRKERTLSMDDIQHYRKIIKVLDETDRIMNEIDKIDFLARA